jgi:hypothetical protein
VGTPVNWPSREPMAVRLAPTMTMSDMERASGMGPAGCRNDPILGPYAAVRQTGARNVMIRPWKGQPVLNRRRDSGGRRPVQVRRPLSCGRRRVRGR